MNLFDLLKKGDIVASDEDLGIVVVQIDRPLNKISAKFEVWQTTSYAATVRSVDLFAKVGEFLGVTNDPKLLAREWIQANKDEL